MHEEIEEQLILGITDPAQELEALRSISKVLGAEGYTTAYRGAASGDAEGWQSSVSPAHLHSYGEHFYKEDPFVPVVTRLGERPFVSTALIPHQELTETGYYHDWAKDSGVESFVGINLELDPHIRRMIAFHRTPDQPPFEADSIEWRHFQDLSKTIRSVYKSAETLRRASSIADANQRALHALNIAVIHIDAKLRVVFQNHAAAELPGLQLNNGQAIQAPGSSGKALKQAIQRVLQGRSRTERISLWPRDHDRPLSVEVVAAPTRDQEVRATLFIQRADHTSPRQIDRWMQRHFGLTPAEGRVAAQLALGASPAEIAAKAGKSIDTVKAQLKRVFAKANVSSSREWSSLALELAPNLNSLG